jgi:hypothetical protein
MVVATIIKIPTLTGEVAIKFKEKVKNPKPIKVTERQRELYQLLQDTQKHEKNY